MKFVKNSKNWLLLFLFIFQVGAQLLGFYLQNTDYSDVFLLNILISLEYKITENWAIFSVILILIVFGNLLYTSLLSEESVYVLKTLGLLVLNLTICNKLYSITSIKKKLNYISRHLPTTIVITLLIIIILMVIMMLNKKKNKEENEEMQEKNDDHTTESINDNKNNEQMADAEEQEKIYRIKYPLSYAINAYVNDREEQRKINREHKKELLQLKRADMQKKQNLKIEELKNRSKKHTDIVDIVSGYISAFVAFVACVVVVYGVCYGANISMTLESFTKILEDVMDVTELIGNAEEPLINFLLSIGTPFLIGLLLITVYLLIYLVFRVMIYLIRNIEEDTNKIKKYGRLIKTFIFGAIDSVMRILLFLPDIIQCVEDFILDTDLDEKIDDTFSDVQNDNSSVPNESSNNDVVK